MNEENELETHGGGKSQLAKQIQNQHKELYEHNLHIGIKEELLDELCKKMKKINICIFCNKKQLLQYMNFFDRKGCLFDLITWHKTNRRYIGMEIDKEYHRIAVNRLNGITANGQLSIFTDISKIESRT